MTNQDLNYYLYDVFSLGENGGGQLAIVEVPREVEDLVSEKRLQEIAKDFNFPETVFVYDSEEYFARLRIFTIAMELPMAGHPTIGTAFHLNTTRDAPDKFVLDLLVGPTKIEFENQNAYMFQQPHEYREPENLDIDRLCEAVGLELADLNNDLPIEYSSAGLEFLMIPVKNVDSLSKSIPNTNIGSDLLRHYGTEHVYLFTKVEENTYRTRMYDLSGADLVEDPATGSAAGSFTMYLYKNDKNIELVNNSLTIHQGFEMGRPSEIKTRVVEIENGKYVPRIGGTAMHVGSGTKPLR